MFKKGFSMVSVVASVCILAMVIAIMFRFLLQENFYVYNNKLTNEDYNDVTTLLSQASVEDNEMNGSLDTTSAEYEGISVFDEKVVVVNGKSIPYEMFYLADDEGENNKISNFVYNIEEITSANVIEGDDTGDEVVEEIEIGSVFPLEPNSSIETEPYDDTSSEIVYGLLNRMGSTHIPRLSYEHVDYLRDTANLVEIDEDVKYIYNTYNKKDNDTTRFSKWDYITQDLINDGINSLKANIDSDGNLSDKHQVLFFERDLAFTPVLFPTDTTIEIDLTPLSKNGEEVDFIFITNGVIGTRMKYSMEHYSNINVKGGNVYFISMGQSRYVYSNFYVNKDSEYYNGKDVTPQFTYAITLPSRQDAKTKVPSTYIGIGGNASLFVYAPSTYVELTGLGRDDMQSLEGGVVLKRNSYKYSGTNNDSLKRVEWKGSQDILGFYSESYEKSKGY